MTIEKEVIEIISDQFGIPKDELTKQRDFQGEIITKNRTIREVNLINDLGADSLDIVELMMDIEDKYHIEIPDQDLDTFEYTIGNVIDYLENIIKTYPLKPKFL